jgi:hypothetical protein
LGEEGTILHARAIVPVSRGLEKPYRAGVASRPSSAVPDAAHPAPFARTFERLVAKVGETTPGDQMAALHRAFEERTGAFGPDDPWFEVRSRAFWDDVMTGARAPRFSKDSLDPADRLWAEALRRPHRGLFRSRMHDGRLVLADAVTGAELVVHEVDDASRDALASTTGLFDGVVVGVPPPVRLALLPGAIFHPEGAEEAILRVIAAGRARALTDGALLDALLRMELSLRTLSRVKPSYAYRAEALVG